MPNHNMLLTNFLIAMGSYMNMLYTCGLIIVRFAYISQKIIFLYGNHKWVFYEILNTYLVLEAKSL